MDLDHFRNLGRQKVHLHPRYNLILGRNGQGKTNFLEAVGYLGSLRSIRGAGRSEMIGHGEKLCRVSGGIASGELERVLTFALTDKGRTQFLDDKKVSSPEEYLQALKVVHFIPEDVGLVSGTPSWRRRVVDRSVFEITPQYVSEYRRYLLALRQRNALLRKGGAPAGELRSWNMALASSGARLVRRRRHLIDSLNPIMESLGEELRLERVPGLTYIASCEREEPVGQARRKESRADVLPCESLLDDRAIEQGILESLAHLEEREARRGYTLAGPHRDDIVFYQRKGGEKTDLARYGSQGQKRGAVLAFKLALAILFNRTNGFWPVVLLDDVASELDKTRRRGLGKIIRGTQAQFFITTTGEEYMFLPAEEGKIFQVNDGRLEPLKAPNGSDNRDDG